MPRVECPAMSDYGVPIDLDGALSWEWATERLISNHNYWVVTVDADGQPHSMPGWGVWSGDDSFWFSCSPNALKAFNIGVNPKVVVNTSDTVEVVSVEGIAENVPVPHDTALAWATKDQDGSRTIDEMIGFFSSQAAFRGSPHKAIGTIERAEEFAQRATRWSWAT